jgi:hypothetical protein
MFLRNVGELLLDYTASEPGKSHYSVISLVSAENHFGQKGREGEEVSWPQHRRAIAEQKRPRSTIVHSHLN